MQDWSVFIDVVPEGMYDITNEDIEHYMRYPKNGNKTVAYFSFKYAVEECDECEFHFYTGCDGTYADDLCLPNSLCKDLQRIFYRTYPDLELYCNDAESLHTVINSKTFSESDIKVICDKLTEALLAEGWMLFTDDDEDDDWDEDNRRFDEELTPW